MVVSLSSSIYAFVFLFSLPFYLLPSLVAACSLSEHSPTPILVLVPEQRQKCVMLGVLQASVQMSERCGFCGGAF